METRLRSTSGRGQAHSKPPRYIIDLSLPPRQRYQLVATDFKQEMRSLPFLFDEVLGEIFPNRSPRIVKKLASLLLRRVNNREETEELWGFQKVTGIDMYLLVAFNVLLDLFMGCTSGGAQITKDDGSRRMMHFRTLDWGMNALRKVIVQLDFVQSSDGPVVASSVTYAGYVGVLTGVRQGLSLSLNFRPNHDASTKIKNFRFYFHHLLVLLGLRPSISSILRRCLVETSGEPQHSFTNLSTIQRTLPGIATTAAYLIFSNGERTITMEKDHRTALVRSATDFIAITNHDAADEGNQQPNPSNGALESLQATGMLTLVEESTDRKRCIVNMWEKASKKAGRRDSVQPGTSMPSIAQRTLRRWIDAYPVTNEETHFSCVMDPQDGRFSWIKCLPEGSVEAR